MGNQKPKHTICSVKVYYIAAYSLDKNLIMTNYNTNNYTRLTLNAIDVIAITPFDGNLYVLELNLIEDSPYDIRVRIGLPIKYLISSNEDVRKIKERLVEYYETKK